ncbi:MAG TPA: ATP-binding protein [Terriglobales bacterium]|nr:ATP-binding protein [Terriglobales bacterium]
MDLGHARSDTFRQEAQAFDDAERAALRDCATRLWPERAGIARHWSAGLIERDLASAGGEPAAVDNLTGLNLAFLELILRHLQAGELEQLLANYYEINRQLIAHDIALRGQIRITLDSLYTSARLGEQAILHRLSTHPAERHAFVKLFAYLMMAVGRAYSDCHEQDLRAALERAHAAEEALQHANAELERRVLERTHELEATNHALAAEIAEREQTELALHASRQRLTLVVNHAPIVVFRLSQQGVLTLAEGSHLRALALTPEQVIGRHPTEVFPDVPALPPFLARALSGQEASVVLELQGLHWLVKTVPMQAPDGVLAGASGVAIDITERVRAEHALRLEKEFSDTTIDSLPGIFYLFDTNGTMRRWNTNFELVTGYAFHEVAGMHPLDFVAEPDRAMVGERIREVFEKGQANVEASFQPRTGRAVPLFLTGRRLTLDGVTCLAGMGIDISERKDAEEELRRRTAELAASNRELEQFASIASHDLQEPLRAVGGYLELLRKRESGTLSLDGRELLEQAFGAVGRMQTLTHDLLAYARVDTTHPPHARVDCEALLQDVCDVLNLRISESGAVVTHDPLPVVTGDVSQVRQLLQNLLSNALKFRGAAPPRIHISARCQQHRWIFSVQDNGIGFDPRYHDRIFAIFKRLHPRSRIPGSGVGLAICKKIVERHGGEIWAQSQVDKGSTFFFSLPAPERAGEPRGQTV